MKVLQVLPALESGGVERGTLEVAHALVEAGAQSYVVSAGGRLVAELEAAGSTHFVMPVGEKKLSTLLCIGRMKRLLLGLQPDILHLRSRLPAWISYLAWRQLPEQNRPKLITTVHGLYSVSKYSRIMTRGERIIAVSDTVRAYIERSYPDVDSGRIRTIYRGVDNEEFPYGYRPSEQWLANWQREFPQLSGRFVIVLPGRITRLKGHQDFIELLALLKSRNLPVHGLIAGDEDPRRRQYAQSLRDEVARRGLQQYITFSGHRGDIKEVMAAADLVVSLSSKPESFGRTSLEALRMGTPVIGYSHGGVGEILGRLYPDGAVAVGDVAATATQVTKLIDGKLAKPREQSEVFSKASMLQQTLELYRSII